MIVLFLFPFSTARCAVEGLLLLQERLVDKGFLVDRWMLRTAGWRSLQQRRCRRQEVRLRPQLATPIGREKSTTSKELSVDMIVRRPYLLGEHTCLCRNLFLAVSMLGSVKFFFFLKKIQNHSLDILAWNSKHEQHSESISDDDSACVNAVYADDLKN